MSCAAVFSHKTRAKMMLHLLLVFFAFGLLIGLLIGLLLGLLIGLLAMPFGFSTKPFKF